MQLTLWRFALAWLFISLTGPASGQVWPTKEVRVIVPYPGRIPISGRLVGGLAAEITEFLAQRLGTTLGQSVVPQYIPGSYGRLAMEATLKSPPDGYTFLYGDLNTIILTRAFDDQIGYDPFKDLIPVVQLGVAPYCLVVDSTSRAQSVKDLMEQSGKGSPIRFASLFGSGSASHLYAEMLARAAGIQVIHVMQKGSVFALLAIREKRADAVFDKCGFPREKVGSFVSLAATGKERLQAFPNIPTLVEEGYPIDLYDWIGIFTRAGTPREIVERMAIESSKAAHSPEGRESLRISGFVVTGITSENFLATIKQDAPRWAEVIRVSGAKRD